MALRILLEAFLEGSEESSTSRVASIEAVSLNPTGRHWQGGRREQTTQQLLDYVVWHHLRQGACGRMHYFPNFVEEGIWVLR